MQRCPEKIIKPLGTGIAIALSSVALENTDLSNFEPEVAQALPISAFQNPEADPAKHNIMAVNSGKLITAVAKEGKLPFMLKRIGGCESGRPASPRSKIRYRAQNPISTASGGFQELDSTWNGYMGYKKARFAPPRIQRRHAKKLYLKHGTQPWMASRGCWAY
jgi:hypothetical protein